MLSRIKHLVVSLLPGPLRRWIRRFYCPYQVRRFTADRWPCAPVVRRLVRPGDCVVDAGANIGYITALLAAWVGGGGRVHSIEPVPETFDLLQRSVRALGLRQVTPHRCAVSNEEGEGAMEIPAYPGGGENYYESHLIDASARGRNESTFGVPLRRLDELLRAAQDRVSFMKMDVEGHEGKALEGAAEILRRSRPALLVEVAGDPDEASSSAAAVFRLLAGAGYRAYTWQAGALRPRSEGDRAVDYFFLMDHHLQERLGDLKPSGEPSGRDA